MLGHRQIRIPYTSKYISFYSPSVFCLFVSDLMFGDELKFENAMKVIYLQGSKNS